MQICRRPSVPECVLPQSKPSASSVAFVCLAHARELRPVGVAYTRIDVDNFVKEGLTEGETPLMKSHEAMVKTAREARLAVLNFIRNPVGI